MELDKIRCELQSVAERYNITAIDECLHIGKPATVCIRIDLINGISIAGSWVYIKTEKSTIALAQVFTDLRVNVCDRGRW